MISIRIPPSTDRLFLALSGSLPRLIQDMDMSTSATAGSPKIDAVTISARDVWM